jgi:vacuolar-type H+-ATPase subunit I/STV1
MAKEKKEDRKKNPEALGIAGFTLGITSIVMLIFSPLMGILLSLVGFFLSLRQQGKQKTRTARVGMILCIIGLVLNLATWYISAQYLYPYLQQQLGSTGYTVK